MHIFIIILWLRYCDVSSVLAEASKDVSLNSCHIVGKVPAHQDVSCIARTSAKTADAKLSGTIADDVLGKDVCPTTSAGFSLQSTSVQLIMMSTWCAANLTTTWEQPPLHFTGWPFTDNLWWNSKVTLATVDDLSRKISKTIEENLLRRRIINRITYKVKTVLHQQR